VEHRISAAGEVYVHVIEVPDGLAAGVLHLQPQRGGAGVQPGIEDGDGGAQADLLVVHRVALGARDH